MALDQNAHNRNNNTITRHKERARERERAIKREQFMVVHDRVLNVVVCSQ